MRQGLVLSGLLHLGLVLVSAASLQFPLSKPALEPQPLAIEMASLAELTKQKAGGTKPELKSPTKTVEPKKPLRSGTANKKSVRKSKPKTRQKSATRVAAPASPKQEAEILLGLKKSKRPKAADEPKQANSRRLEKPVRKPEFNSDKIAALLNKTPEAAAGGDRGPVSKGRADGRDATMTISEIDALRARISQCWSPPVAGLGAGSISVRLRMKLKRDGTLATAPTLVSTHSSPVFRAAADSAIRAVWQCQPYVLPAAKYALWQDMILNFDPKEMIGG